MPKPYSVDLRARVIEDVETGASRREAAERYGISPSVVVIWVQRFEETGSVAAKPSGGSTSPLEQHAEFLLGLICEATYGILWLCEGDQFRVGAFYGALPLAYTEHLKQGTLVHLDPE